MTNHRGKFLFDTVFENGKPLPEEPAKPQPKFTEDDLVAARREGQEVGFRNGMEQAKREHEAQLAAAMTTAAQTLGSLRSALDSGLESIKADATEVALAAARRLAPTLIDRQPLAELSEMVAECLRQMPTEPRVVIRVADALVDALEPQVEELGRSAGFAGQLVLIGEPQMAVGDARVEWADGGAERNIAALQGEIDAAVDRFVRGQRDSAPRAQAAASPAPASEAAPPAAEAAAPEIPQLDDFDDGLPALSGADGQS